MGMPVVLMDLGPKVVPSVKIVRVDVGKTRVYDLQCGRDTLITRSTAGEIVDYLMQGKPKDA